MSDNTVFNKKISLQPRVLLEPLMRDDINNDPIKIQVYCFNGNPEIFIEFYNHETMSIWDKEFNTIEDIFDFAEKKIVSEANLVVKQTYELSKKLAINFLFVRVDWMIYKNKLWFEELTFTPFSGFHKFKAIRDDIKLGNLINIEKVC